MILRFTLLILFVTGVAHAAAPGLKIKKLSENSYALVFDKGDEVLSGLQDFAVKNDIKTAHFHAIGALKSVSFGWFDDKKKQFLQHHIDTPVEVTSLEGDIALFEGKPQVHAHINVADSAGNVHGGHLFSGTVFPTIELFVTVEPTPLVKETDPETKLNLIKIKTGP